MGPVRESIAAREDVFSITALKSDVPARTPGRRDAAGKPNKMKLEGMEEMIVPQDTRADSQPHDSGGCIRLWGLQANRPCR